MNGPLGMNPRTSDIFLFSPAYESRTEVELEFYLQKTEQTDISLNLQNSSFFLLNLIGIGNALHGDHSSYLDWCPVSVEIIH